MKKIALFALFASLLLAGCITPPAETTPTPLPSVTPAPSPTPTASPTPDQTELGERVREVVASENPDRADELLDLGEGAVPVYLELLRENSTFGRWCALYALSNVAFGLPLEEKQTITQELQPLFTQEPTSIKMMAGAVATELGDKRGIPVLIECLNETARFRDSEPPAPICYYANDFLVRFAREDFNHSCNYNSYDADAMGEWAEWWNVAGAELEWNDGGKFYGVPNE